MVRRLFYTPIPSRSVHYSFSEISVLILVAALVSFEFTLRFEGSHYHYSVTQLAWKSRPSVLYSDNAIMEGPQVGTLDSVSVESWLLELRMECYRRHLEDYPDLKVNH